MVQADTIVAKGLSDGATSGALAVDQAVLNFSHGSWTIVASCLAPL